MESGVTLPFGKNISLVCIVSQMNNLTYLFSLTIVLILFTHQPLGLASKLFPSGSNTLFSNLFSKNFSVCSSLEVTNKVCTPMQNKTQINVIYIWCFYYRLEKRNKASRPEWQKASDINVIFYFPFFKLSQKVFGITVVFILVFCPGF